MKRSELCGVLGIILIVSIIFGVIGYNNGIIQVESLERDIWEYECTIGRKNSTISSQARTIAYKNYVIDSMNNQLFFFGLAVRNLTLNDDFFMYIPHTYMLFGLEDNDLMSESTLVFEFDIEPKWMYES